jgi:alanyl-tRNA synthetase
MAYRVVADHIRTLSFSIADGIVPGNSDRNYVLRRILRRAVRYGRTLGFSEPFFYKLVDTLAAHMGGVFPELKQRKDFVKQTLKTEEEAFNRTLDKGILLFEKIVAHSGAKISGEDAFLLYDTYGFPLDLTELMARESGLAVDKAGFERLMQEQRERARSARTQTVIKLSEIETKEPTEFKGYDAGEVEAKVLEVVHMDGKAAVVLDVSPFYAEMGGQLGDMGTLLAGAEIIPVLNTQKSGNTWLHYVDPETTLEAGVAVTARVDGARLASRCNCATSAASFLVANRTSKSDISVNVRVSKP